MVKLDNNKKQKSSRVNLKEFGTNLEYLKRNALNNDSKVRNLFPERNISQN